MRLCRKSSVAAQGGSSSRKGAASHSSPQASRLAPRPAAHRSSAGVTTHAAAAAASTPTEPRNSAAAPVPEGRNPAAGPVLVDGLVVQPAYRSTPWEAEAQHAGRRDKALLMFVSESGICRGPLAAAVFRQLLQDSPLHPWVDVQMRAARDYCEGQGPHPAAAAAAARLGITLPPSATPDAADAADAAAAAPSPSNPSAAAACVFEPANDIVAADLVLVMDKFTAADVLREVSSYDLINPGGRYSARVRLLGSFHPRLDAAVPEGQDIGDALYGNVGGAEEEAAVAEAAKLIVEACRNLLEQLTGLATANGLLPGDGTSSSDDAGAAAAGDAGGAAFRRLLVQHVQQEGVMDWLVPPMLQGSNNSDLGGWV